MKTIKCTFSLSAFHSNPSRTTVSHFAFQCQSIMDICFAKWVLAEHYLFVLLSILFDFFSTFKSHSRDIVVRKDWNTKTPVCGTFTNKFVTAFLNRYWYCVAEGSASRCDIPSNDCPAAFFPPNGSKANCPPRTCCSPNQTQSSGKEFRNENLLKFPRYILHGLWVHSVFL